MNFPTLIHFLSDDTEDVLKGEIKSKERAAIYEFTKSKVNQGKTFSMTMNQIERLIQDKRIKTK